MGEIEVNQRDPRAAIANALMDYLTDEQCHYLIDEVLSIDKLVPIEIVCDNCNHVVKGKALVPDAKAVVSALTDLLAQGFGRPGEAKVEDGTIIFKRLVKMEPDEAPPKRKGKKS